MTAFYQNRSSSECIVHERPLVRLGSLPLCTVGQSNEVRMIFHRRAAIRLGNRFARLVNRRWSTNDFSQKIRYATGQLLIAGCRSIRYERLSTEEPFCDRGIRFLQCINRMIAHRRIVIPWSNRIIGFTVYLLCQPIKYGSLVTDPWFWWRSRFKQCVNRASANDCPQKTRGLMRHWFYAVYWSMKYVWLFTDPWFDGAVVFLKQFVNPSSTNDLSTEDPWFGRAMVGIILSIDEVRIMVERSMILMEHVFFNSLSIVQARTICPQKIHDLEEQWFVSFCQTTKYERFFTWDPRFDGGGVFSSVSIGDVRMIACPQKHRDPMD